MRFLDTNVLLYAISRDPSERRKAAIAREVLASPAQDLALSVQVLQEFYVQATRPSRAGALSHRLAVEYLDLWRELPVQDVTLALLQSAVASCHRFGISYWDAAIVEAARALGCRTLLSEDMQHGASYGGVRVLNPFRLPSP